MKKKENRMKAKPAFNRRYTLRRPTGGSGSVKPQSGLRPWCGFTPPQFWGCWNCFSIPLSQPQNRRVPLTLDEIDLIRTII